MDMLNQISDRIAQLNAGEKWTVSVHDLLISRTDFHSISIFLTRESEKGTFSLTDHDAIRPHLGHTSLTIIKN